MGLISLGVACKILEVIFFLKNKNIVILNSSLLKFLLFHNGHAGVGDCCSLENDNETPIFNNSGKTFVC